MPEFSFPAEIPMDKTHQLDQKTARFGSVKSGLPELVKNAKDQYARLGIAERDERQIVVVVDTSGKRLAVLDFAGARSNDFSGWKTWSSRTAGRAHLAHDIEAGHGNGGKSFMVSGSSETAFIESCYHGHRTAMGFDNADPTVRYFPGYLKQNGQDVRDLPEMNPRGCLEKRLKTLRVSFDSLPPAARRVFEQHQAYTMVLVEGVQEWHRRWSKSLQKLAEAVPVNLANHAQAAGVPPFLGPPTV